MMRDYKTNLSANQKRQSTLGKAIILTLVMGNMVPCISYADTKPAILPVQGNPILVDHFDNATLANISDLTHYVNGQSYFNQAIDFTGEN